MLGSSALLPAGLGFRNVLINGGFDVWQRGTSPTAIASTSSSAFLADRWQATRYASGSKQSQIFPSLDGFRYGIRIQRDSGNTSTNVIYLSQSFEGDVAIKLANKPVALSFYARAGSNYSPTSSFLYVGLNTGTGSEANVVYGTFAGLIPPSINSNVTLTTSWQRFTFIANIPSGTTQAGLLFSMSPTGTASTNDYFEITGVQLEQNLQPTPFEQRPIGVELGLCQRYYERISGNTGTSEWANIGSGGWDGSSRFCLTYNYLTIKRVRPSVFSSGSGINCLYHGVAWQAVTGVNSYTEISNRALRINYDCSGTSVQGQSGIAAITTASSYIEISAEL
jgi:hypothetical protein